MKILLRLSVVLMFISFFSCDKEEIKGDNIVDLTKKAPVNRTEDLENRMQWVSYIGAEALLKDESAEAFFIDVLASDSQTNTITLETLLGSNNAFRQAFVSEFYYYLIGDICRVPKPSGGPKPPNEEEAMPIHDLYINMLLNDYDFEFYLPNEYNEGANNIKSSAYETGSRPRNLQGYIHFEQCDVEDIVITPNSRGNILILRTH